MKRIKVLFLLVAFLCCLSTRLFAATAVDDGLKSLRIVRIATSENTAWFVPAHAAIRGPGLATSPLKLLIGDDLLIQGMISLQEDPAELEVLISRVKKQYGDGMSVKKDLAVSINMRVCFENSILWEAPILSNSQGLPFQVRVPGKNASGTLSLVLQFSPGGNAAENSARATIHRVRQFSTNSTGFKEETEVITSSSERDSAVQKAFSVEQIVEF